MNFIMDFKNIYEECILDSQRKNIASSNFSSEPIMVNGVISPESTICIQPLFGIEFQLDKDGMNRIIDMFETKWNARTEAERKNLMVILNDIYSITEDYLGGHGIPQVRQNAYFEAENNCLNLSEIQGKNIGLCAERAAIGHQLISILERAGLINLQSFLTNSHMTVTTKEPHSFIVLKHKTDTSKQYVFDIENPLKYKPSKDSEPVNGIALYSMTQEQFEKFKKGKSICPQSIFEQFGMEVVDDKRFYGDEDVNKTISMQAIVSNAIEQGVTSDQVTNCKSGNTQEKVNEGKNIND